VVSHPFHKEREKDGARRIPYTISENALRFTAGFHPFRKERGKDGARRNLSFGLEIGRRPSYSSSTVIRSLV